jgi:peroxiredoxin
MVEVGDTMPDARVSTGPRETTMLRELLTEGPVLLFFYLFDWSGT